MLIASGSTHVAHGTYIHSRRGFAALHLSLDKGVVLPFPPEHYIYPARDDWPDCVMLAFQPGDGIIGSYVMQNRSLFVDQDSHTIGFLTPAAAREVPTLTVGDDVGIGVGGFAAAVLLFGGAYWIWDRRRDAEEEDAGDGYALMKDAL